MPKGKENPNRKFTNPRNEYQRPDEEGPKKKVFQTDAPPHPLEIQTKQTPNSFRKERDISIRKNQAWNYFVYEYQRSHHGKMPSYDTWYDLITSDIR